MYVTITAELTRVNKLGATLLLLLCFLLQGSLRWLLPQGSLCWLLPQGSLRWLWAWLTGPTWILNLDIKTSSSDVTGLSLALA